MSFLGSDEFCQFGIGGAATVAFGAVTGGQIGDSGSKLTHVGGIGGQDGVAWGLIKPTATIETTYQGEALLGYCNRTQHWGLPPEIQIWGGLVNETGQSFVQAGYVDKVTVLCPAAEDPIQVNYDVVGYTLAATTATAGQVATPVATVPYVLSSGQVVVGGVTFPAESFTLVHMENLMQVSDLGAKAAGPQRRPSDIDAGDERVTAQVVVELPTSLDLTTDTVATAAPLTATFTLANGYTTKTIGLGQIFLKSATRATEFVDDSSTVTWLLDGESTYNARAIGSNPWNVS